MHKAFLLAISTKITKSELSSARSNISRLGFSSIHLPTILSSDLSYAGTVTERLDQLHSAFSSKADLILFARGGYGAVHLLPQLDLPLIKKNSKPLIGYSDITILLNYLYQKLGMITFHGPNMMRTFPSNDKSLECLKDLLSGKRLTYSIAGRDVLIPGKVKAPLVGGNIALLIRSLGTPYEFVCDDSIIFLEAWQKSGQLLYDMLYQLFLAGKFDSCKGVILGHFTECGNFKPYLKKFFSRFDFPVIWNQKFGHELPNYAVPVGGSCVLDTHSLFWKVSQNQYSIL